MASRSDADAIRSFVDDYSVNEFEHVIDEGGLVWSKYGIVSQPAFALINDDGTVETKIGAMGPDRLTDAVQQLTST